MDDTTATATLDEAPPDDGTETPPAVTPDAPAVPSVVTAGPCPGDEPFVSARPMFGLSRFRGYRTRALMQLADFTITAAASEGSPGRFSAIIVVEGIRTTDHREVMPGALTWRDLPLPWMGLDTTTWGHDDAVFCGVIETIDRVNNQIIATGYYYDNDAGRTFNQYTVDQAIRWVSVDLEVIDSEYIEILVDATEVYDPYWDEWLIDGEWDWWERITNARIMGATQCPFPAFPQAVVVVEGQDFPETAADNGLPTLVAPGLAASGFVTPPVDPPAAWFDNPELTEPTHLTVTDDGRVFGHIATWGTCHTSYPGVCVAPPRSASGYAYYATGSVAAATDDGSRSVRTGVLTLGTGHADPNASWRPASDHYDNTGAGVADLAIGEDDHGIWVSGALRSTVTPEQVRVLRASDVSGDWRRLAGEYELVGLLVVNVPGFPIPAVAASGASIQIAGVNIPQISGPRAGVHLGEQISLVAAGMVRNDPVGDALRAVARRLSTLEAAVAPLRSVAARELADRILSPTP